MMPTSSVLHRRYLLVMCKSSHQLCVSPQPCPGQMQAMGQPLINQQMGAMSYMPQVEASAPTASHQPQVGQAQIRMTLNVECAFF